MAPGDESCRSLAASPRYCGNVHDVNIGGTVSPKELNHVGHMGVYAVEDPCLIFPGDPGVGREVFLTPPWRRAGRRAWLRLWIEGLAFISKTDLVWSLTWL